ncbi:MAG: type II toxin-antitoxin system Phd/YefM family antitoxin [Deltaproteobacteria bacterium]|nr:type II toxin-antitoxin system Phd/YefM family antitoxin [Deltaproteobacteria bacterium]
MIKAGIKEIKNNLSRYLARVKIGEEVIITDRGKPVARIVQESQRNRDIHTALLPLIQKGLIVLPSRRLEKDHLTPIKVKGKQISEMVIEDRR